MPRSSIRSVLALSTLALLPCCGGGSGGGNEPGVHALSPATFFAEFTQPLTVLGAGFGAPGAATVRLTAASGTPFVGGTTDFVDVAATVLDDRRVTFDSPLALLCPSTSVPVAVRVTLADATVYDSDGFIATLAGPTLSGFAPTPVPATVATPFEITGAGFGPVPGLASVEFTASAGTPFAGGTSATATVPGTVASAGTITGTSPVAAAGPDFTASVKVTFANGSCVTSSADFVAFEANAAPIVSTTAPSDLRLALGDRVSFTVTATDAEGDPVTLRLLDPPAGATFPAILNAASPAAGTLQWVVQATDEPGPVALLFRTNDSVNPTKSRTFAVWTHLTPAAVRTVRVGDVTGDGKDDLVVLARNADAGGVSDAGEIYVWAGAAVPSGAPTASLRVTGAVAGDQLGSGGLRLADVTGDGTLDVLAATDKADVGGVANAGALYVWFGGGGLTGTKGADATLTIGAFGASTGLAADPLRWQVGDVTGEGTADVVAAAPLADRVLVDTGGAFVWRGGGTLVGLKSWDIELVSSGITAGDELGGGGVLLADVSGDGVLDVVAAAPKADGGGLAVDSGALFLWKTNLAPVGPPVTLVAHATMRATGGIGGESLGAAAAATLRLEDVTGDGIRDVVAPSPGATAGAVASGAIYVWFGGATLTGLKGQDATLAVAAPAIGDALAGGAAGRVLVGDVTDDGFADVVGVAATADAGLTIDAGALYVWKGGATLTGAKAPDATLTVPAPTAGDRLGSGGTRLAEVTGDGVLDVVSAAPLTDAGVSLDVGAVHVWAGGAGLTGPKSPTASLRVAGSADDRLGYDAKETTFASRFGDVSGDGTLDVVVPAFRADVSGVADAGAVYAWRGGGTLTGTPAPLATLVEPGPVSGDMLGLSSGANVALADVSGDAVLDVVAAASAADFPGALNAGAIHAWKGGATLTGTKTPTATMRAGTPASGDQLAGGVPDGVAWDLVDVTADGVRDVVAVACLADTAAGANAGAGYAWSGGAAMTGNRAPTATFLAPNATGGDMLGCSGGTVDLLFPVDLTDDGMADVLIGGSSYTDSGPSERGGLFLWQGSAGLSGSPAPLTSFLVPTAVALDRLGN